MNRAKRRANKQKNYGMTTGELDKIYEIARRESTRMEKRAIAEATDRAFLYMLAIPLNVLAADYWPATAKQRMPKFIDEVLKLYTSVQDGIVTERELADVLDDMAGVKISEMASGGHVISTSYTQGKHMIDTR